VQGNGGLAGAGHALDDQHRRVLVADDGVLVALDGGDDVLHAVVGRAAQLLLQYFVDHVHRAFDQQVDGAVLDTELALAGDLAFHLAFRCLVAGGAGLVVVEEGGDGGAPVVDDGLVVGVVVEAVHADIGRLRLLLPVTPEVEAAEIGRALQLLEAGALGEDGITGGDRLLDGLALTDLLDVVHLVAAFPEVFLLGLDFLL